MTPILYPSTEEDFKNNGIGILSDAVKCIVTEERNGAFELEITYPIDGIHYDEIKTRRLVMAKPNPIDDPQPFRIYRITRPLSGLVTIYASILVTIFPVFPYLHFPHQAQQKLYLSYLLWQPLKARLFFGPINLIPGR